MSSIVTLRNTLTGQTKEYVDEHYSEYMWEDGNYSCDCNRGLFLNGEQLPCNTGENVIVIDSVRISIHSAYDAEGNEITDQQVIDSTRSIADKLTLAMKKGN